MVNKNKPAGDAYKARAAKQVEMLFVGDKREYYNARHSRVSKLVSARLVKAPSKELKAIQADIKSMKKKIEELKNVIRKAGYYYDDNELRVDSDSPLYKKTYSEFAKIDMAKERDLIAQIYASETVADVEAILVKAENI